ncbi:MAG: hypothetical protein ACI4D3_02950 [Lachnospiraceae bacterium]
MANLHDVYRLVCCGIISRFKGGKVPLMSENDFYAAVLTNELKMNYPGVLNPGHHTFKQKDFDTLAEKRAGSQMLLQSLLLYFISHPSDIDALCGSCRSFYSTRISIIHPEHFRKSAHQWFLQLHLSSRESLSQYLKNALKFAEPLQSYATLTAWMLLDAFCSGPDALCLLYQKYSHADKNVPVLSGCSGMISGLRVLYAHAVKAMEQSEENNKNALCFILAREFNRMQNLYQKNQKTFPEKYRPLIQESLDYFDRYLLDLEKKSPMPYYNLDLMEKDVKKLEELLEREAL